jgi:hypothetical protein
MLTAGRSIPSHHSRKDRKNRSCCWTDLWLDAGCSGSSAGENAWVCELGEREGGGGGGGGGEGGGGRGGIGLSDHIHVYQCLLAFSGMGWSLGARAVAAFLLWVLVTRGASAALLDSQGHGHLDDCIYQPVQPVPPLSDIMDTQPAPFRRLLGHLLSRNHMTRALSSNRPNPLPYDLSTHASPKPTCLVVTARAEAGTSR